MKLIILIVALVFLSNCREINVTCGNCTMTCATGNKCYAAVGDNYTEQFCVSSDTCPFETMNYNVVPCKVDASNTVCSAGVCVAPNAKTCYILGCLFGGSFDYSCGTCASTAGCNSCYKFTLLGFDSETCMDNIYTNGTTCDWSYSFATESCSGDDFGNTCSCCSTSTYRNTGNCASSDRVFQNESTQLEAWAEASADWIRTFGVALIAFMMILY